MKVDYIYDDHDYDSFEEIEKRYYDIDIYPMMFSEAINECDKQIVADEKILTNERKIETVLSKLKGYSDLIICDHSKTVYIGNLKFVNHFDNSIFTLGIKTKFMKTVILYVEINKLKILQDMEKANLETIPISEDFPGISRCKNIKELLDINLSERYVLDGNFIIDVIPTKSE